MREYVEKRKTTKQLNKILCDTCKKEIHKINTSKEAYLSTTAITAEREFSSEGWLTDYLEFCSVECFLEWAKTETGAFNVHFPYGTLDKIHTEINNELQGGKVNGKI